MKNSVIIKHEQYGLRIQLSGTPEWEELLADVREKFVSSARFFGDASLTLTFSGRPLTEAQEDEVIRIIDEVTDIRVLCVFVEDISRGELFVRAAGKLVQGQDGNSAHTLSSPAENAPADRQQTDPGSPGTSNDETGGRYQMLLRSLRKGEIYKTDRTVIVVGNVEEGAALTTARDAIVLGSVRGVVRAGEEHEGSGRKHFVASSDLRPKKLTVDGVSLRTKSRMFSRAYPAIAAVSGGKITMVPFDGDMEELFREE